MPYVDLNTIHNPATGTVAPATWGDQVRDNDEFLIDPPACSVFNSANQLLTSATATVLDADSENFDNDAMHSTVTNNSRVTATTAGRYLCIATVSFAANGTGQREIRFRTNGTTTFNGVTLPNAGGSDTWRCSATRQITLAASEYVEVIANQNSGSSVNCNLNEFVVTFLTR